MRAGVMPNARAACNWSEGKSTSAARQISQLKADVFNSSAITPAGAGLISTPSSGNAKKTRSVNVIAGVARMSLT